VELNVAVAAVAAFNERVHVDVPPHAPDQPANLDPDAAVAVSLTDVPSPKLALQVVPQLMPEGLLVIVPVPAPALTTVSWAFVDSKAAVTDLEAFGESVQVEDVPLHAPDQPSNLDPDAAVSVSFTDFPLANFALQVFPQLMPAGLLLMVPTPVPEVFTLIVTVEERTVRADAQREIAQMRPNQYLAHPILRLATFIGDI